MEFGRNGQNLFDSRALLFVEAFTFCAVAFNGNVMTETSNGMTPIFIFYALPLGVFFTAEFEFLTPETDVGK